MVKMYYFEIVDGTKVIFCSDYFDDGGMASRRASEIVCLMGKCAPFRMLSFRVLSVDVDAGRVPGNYAL